MQYPFVIFDIIQIAHAGDLVAFAFLAAASLLGPLAIALGAFLAHYQRPHAIRMRRMRQRHRDNVKRYERAQAMRRVRVTRFIP